MTLDLQLKALKFTSTAKEVQQLCDKAIHTQPGYQQHIQNLLDHEIQKRQNQILLRQMKRAQLPTDHDLDEFDATFAQGITKTQLQQLRVLNWLDQAYNIILMGPPGVGKTFIAAGLGCEALKQGHRVYFRTMEEIRRLLIFKDRLKQAGQEYRRLINAHLVIIDDMLVFPLDKHESVDLYHLIDTLHEQTSLIITTNKAPKEWGEILADQAIATAILDRLIYHAQVISLQGESYRMKHRKSIYEKEE